MLITSDYQRLLHIQDAIDKIAEALDNYSPNDFQHDCQKRLVIERLLEIIGEAANHLSQDLKNSHPHIPWAQIVGMRNFVSHEYFRIDADTIWLTATESIPKLRENVENIITPSH